MQRKSNASIITKRSALRNFADHVHGLAINGMLIAQLGNLDQYAKLTDTTDTTGTVIPERIARTLADNSPYAEALRDVSDQELFEALDTRFPCGFAAFINGHLDDNSVDVAKAYDTKYDVAGEITTTAGRRALAHRTIRLEDNPAVVDAADKILADVKPTDVKELISTSALNAGDDRYSVFSMALHDLLLEDPRCEPAEFAKLAGLDEDELRAANVRDAYDVTALIIDIGGEAIIDEVDGTWGRD